MSPSLGIAILSDQHIHTTAAPGSWELARRAFRAAAKYDHVVLAGDTFDSAGAMLHDREVVERYLRELGLWHRDRLTIVVGNHDLFHTPHRGSKVGRILEYGRNALSVDAWRWVRDPAVERAFDEWVAPLASAADRLDARRPFPMRKVLGHVALYADDTAPLRTLSAANGFWRPRTDALLRAATPEADERRVLAIHHPPKLSPQTSAADVLSSIRKGRLSSPVKFPPRNFARLSAFLDDASIDAVVCGHIHTTKRCRWTVDGTAAKVPAFLVGRTGGLTRGAPVIGVLSVPRRGAVRWSEVEV
ncbi:MAG: metallophosphoesterase [Deltaproteobacteria bacterium]|nr:metallophosphoesterase [Deltaproteobacteria bacterium]